MGGSIAEAWAFSAGLSCKRPSHDYYQTYSTLAVLQGTSHSYYKTHSTMTVFPCHGSSLPLVEYKANSTVKRWTLSVNTEEDFKKYFPEETALEPYDWIQSPLILCIYTSI